MSEHTQNETLQERDAETMNQRQTVTPPVDIFENESELLLVAELPGVHPDQLEVELEDGELRIFGRRTSTATEGEVLARGFHELDFERRFRLPQTIDGSKVSADLNAGLLTLHLPKHESVRPRRIQVTAG